MKIIAKVDSEKLFCEITRDEIALMLGIEHAYDIDPDDITVGENIDLARIIKATRLIRSLDERHLVNIIAEMKNALTVVEKVKETLGALTLFDKIRESDTL